MPERFLKFDLGQLERGRAIEIALKGMWQMCSY